MIEHLPLNPAIILQVSIRSPCHSLLRTDLAFQTFPHNYDLTALEFFEVLHTEPPRMQSSNIEHPYSFQSISAAELVTWQETHWVVCLCLSLWLSGQEF